MSIQMNTKPMNPEIASMEARAIADGFLDADGFFTQSDAEFELDFLQPVSRAQLEARLAAPGVDPQTASFLREYMVQSTDVHFEPLQD